jgi:cell division protein YceG involved in septum cleavage
MVEPAPEPTPTLEPSVAEPAPAPEPSVVEPLASDLPESEPPLPQPPLPEPPEPEPLAPLKDALPPPPPSPLRGEQAGSPGGRMSGRSLLARLGALVALAAAIVAVILLIHSLSSSRHTNTVAAPIVVKVVIPEGETRMQIAQIAAKAGLRGSYRAASKRSRLLNPAHYGAPHGTPDLEGFLFPATYDEYPGAPASRLVSDQLVAFKENIGSNLFARAHALHITPYQLLTVASMIEREAQIAGDRPKIAAVIYNRLREGIPLGIDATIYYAVELELGIPTYTGELTASQLQIDSPYNTRTHAGLPPTPISNPGEASIEAAEQPAHVPYLYYVAGADGCGEQVFSTTYSRFQEDVAAYERAVKRNRGKPPACTHKG